MGCDIHGRVEIDMGFGTEGEAWWGVASHLLPFVGRSYDSFAVLFGVRNYTGFEPIADGRGLPEDVARRTREDYEGWGRDAHSASYITYAELEEVDWQETATRPDERYSILDENKEPTGTKFRLGPGGGWSEIVQENSRAIEAGEPVPGPGGERYIQRRVLTRREALSEAWEWLLFDYLGMLADRYGEDAVRMVVWFDN